MMVTSALIWEDYNAPAMHSIQFLVVCRNLFENAFVDTALPGNLPFHRGCWMLLRQACLSCTDTVGQEWVVFTTVIGSSEYSVGAEYL